MKILLINKLFLQGVMIKKIVNNCQMLNLMDVYPTSYIRMEKQHAIMMHVYL